MSGGWLWQTGGMIKPTTISQKQSVQSYSALLHLAYATVPIRNWGKCLMAMFTAYLDDSGHEDSPKSTCIVAAGFLASVEQWLLFEDEWKTALRRNGLPSCFHTMDFVAGRGDYSHLKGKNREKQQILANLIGTIAIRVRRSVSQLVMLDDYAHVNNIYMVQETIGYPFTLAARTCAKSFSFWKDRYAPDAEIKIVIEDGLKHKGDMVDVFDKDRLGIPSFAAKGSFGALQAVDILAWHVHVMKNRSEVNQFIDGTNYDISFKHLGSIPGKEDHGQYSKSDLLATCEELGTPRRDMPKQTR